MENRPIEQILGKIELSEKRAKKRAIAFTLIPLISALILITYTARQILTAQRELNTIESRMRDANAKISSAQAKLDSVKRINDQLKKENDSLKQSLIETTVLLGKQVSVFTEFKKFIDNLKSYDRSYEQAAFWINFRMLEDRIRGNYEELSEKVSKLPELDVDKRWIVIVGSSVSLEDLKWEVPQIAKIYGNDQLAIYQDLKGNYALCVIGNGTFTRAYRLNVELRDKYGYKGAYFAGKSDWGINYLIK